MARISGVRPTFVYAIRCDSFIKIGFGERPVERLGSVKMHCPLPAALVATRKFPNAEIAYSAEKAIHARLVDQAHWGEWFRCGPIDPVSALKEEYDRLAEMLNLPSVITDIDEPAATPRVTYEDIYGPGSLEGARLLDKVYPGARPPG
jgi:hypothetical protein